MGLGGVIWRTLVNFGQESSISGLNNAAKAKSLIRSLVWLALFLVLASLTMRNFILIWMDFNTHPIVTSTELTQEKSVEFPAITVCNLNM